MAVTLVERIDHLHQCGDFFRHKDITLSKFRLDLSFYKLNLTGRYYGKTFSGRFPEAEGRKINHFYGHML